MKLCKDCAFCQNRNFRIIFPFFHYCKTFKCKHPNCEGEISLVDGKFERKNLYCSTERNWGECGKNGEWWVPSRWFKFKEWMKNLPASLKKHYHIHRWNKMIRKNLK